MSRSSSRRGDEQVNIPLQRTSTGRSTRSASTRELFNRYDTNRNGRISLWELRNLITSQNYAQDLPESAVERILERADQDQNGHLDYEEFKLMVGSRDWQLMVRRSIHQYVSYTVPRRPTVRDEPEYPGEYEEQYTCWPPALGMFIISFIEVVTFLIDVFHSDTVMANGPVALKLLYNPYRRFEAWRFLTYMFVHVGVQHLVVNLVVQLLLGVPLEMVHHWWRVLIVYMAGVVAGSLGTSVTDPYIRLAGASGGVYAIMLAHIATIIMNWSEMKLAGYQLAILLILIGTDVGSAIYYRYVLGVDQSIGYAAHLAGAIAGLLVGINVLRNIRVETWERVLWWVSIFVYVLLMLGAVLWNIFYTEYFPPSDKR